MKPGLLVFGKLQSDAVKPERERGRARVREREREREREFYEFYEKHLVFFAPSSQSYFNRALPSLDTD